MILQRIFVSCFLLISSTCHFGQVFVSSRTAGESEYLIPLIYREEIVLCLWNISYETISRFSANAYGLRVKLRFALVKSELTTYGLALNRPN